MLGMTRRVAARYLMGSAGAIWSWEHESPCIQSCETEWKGGIADFGNPQAAMQIEGCRAYRDYAKRVAESVGQALGGSFTLYRSMTREQLAEWLAHRPTRHSSFTFRREVAENWKNFAFNRDKDMVVVEGRFKPRDVLMRGSEAEAELVINLNKIRPKTLKVVG